MMPTTLTPAIVHLDFQENIVKVSLSLKLDIFPLIRQVNSSS